jgi:hypothetical protein
MKFLSEVFDFMFAPAGAFDAESSFSAASSGSIFGQVDATAIKLTTSLPVIEGTGVDVGRSVFAMGVHHHDQSDVKCVCSAETK